MYKVPLIFYGEPLGEFSNYYDYEADKIDLENEEKFLMLRTLGITAEDMHGMINKSDDPIDIRDLSPYTYPDIDELKKLNITIKDSKDNSTWDYE